MAAVGEQSSVSGCNGGGGRREGKWVTCGFRVLCAQVKRQLVYVHAPCRVGALEGSGAEELTTIVYMKLRVTIA